MNEHLLPTAGILNCRAAGLLMLVHLAIFRVNRHESALKRQLRIPADVSGKCKIENQSLLTLRIAFCIFEMIEIN